MACSQDSGLGFSPRMKGGLEALGLLRCVLPATSAGFPESCEPKPTPHMLVAHGEMSEWSRHDVVMNCQARGRGGVALAWSCSRTGFQPGCHELSKGGGGG
jgi:hypothetical protein